MANLCRRCGSVLIGLILGFCLSSWAADIPSPPNLPDMPVSLQHYLGRIFNHLGRIEVTETNPDGSRNGKKGEILLLQTGGSNYIEVNTDGSTTWEGTVLSDTP